MLIQTQGTSAGATMPVTGTTTPSMRDASIRELREMILSSLKDISSDPALIRDFMAFLRRFHDYSFINRILIYIQYPAASQVAGYKAWQKLGRYVRRGEKGIIIFAPLFPRVEPTAEKAPEELSDEVHEQPRPNRFRKVSVFAFEQTDGEPLELPAMGTLETPEPDRLYTDLVAVAIGMGLELHERVLPFSIGGSTDGKRIEINSLNHPAAKVQTLLHEMAHVLLEHSAGRKSIPRAQKEVEAELSCFMAGLAFGIPHGSYEYIRGWQNELNAIPDEAITRAFHCAERIIALSSTGRLTPIAR